MKHKFKKYLKERFGSGSEQQFSFKYFLKKLITSETYDQISGGVFGCYDTGMNELKREQG